MKRIEVIIAQDGKTKLFTKGFAGQECLAASRFLEIALGKTVDDQVTSAYHDIRGRAKARAKRQRLRGSGQP